MANVGPTIYAEEHYDYAYPPVLKNAKIVAAQKVLYRDHYLIEYRNLEDLIAYSWEQLLWDANRQFFPILLDKGPFTIEMRRMRWVDYTSSMGNIHLQLQIRYAETPIDRITIHEFAEPRWELVPNKSQNERKLVFFCGSCGVPYFWGEKMCSGCGAPLEYSNRTKKEF